MSEQSRQTLEALQDAETENQRDTLWLDYLRPVLVRLDNLGIVHGRSEGPDGQDDRIFDGSGDNEDDF